MKLTPCACPTVRPLVSGSNISLPRMKPPAGDRNVAVEDHGPTFPWNTGRTRQVCGASNSRLHTGVQLTEDPEPPPTVAVHTMVFAEFMIWNSYEYAPLRL